MEQALAKDDAANSAAREETDAFAGYQTSMRVGRRDEARTELVRAVAAAPVAGEYRRLLDQLDTALLTAGKLELRRRGKPLIVVCAAPKLVLGRDPLCDLTLRAGGVSRQHAEIERVGEDVPAARSRLAQRHDASRACRSPGASRSRAAAGSRSATSARSTSSSTTERTR